MDKLRVPVAPIKSRLDMIRILVLAPYAFPEQISSTHLDNNLAEAFNNEGITRVVYAPYPSRGVSDADKRYYRKIKREDRYNGLEVIHRFWLYDEGRGTLGRALRYFLCAFSHFKKGCFAKDARSCNLLMVGSTPPIQGAMASLVKKVRHIPMIYVLQDIFPDSLVGVGIAQRGGILWKIGRVIENIAYKNADKIIVISQDFKKNIMSKGVPEDKIVVIYNWVDEQVVIDVPRSENVLFDRYGLDRKKFYVTYNGNIGLTQNMDMLMEVAKDLEHEENIQFVLVGNGSYKDHVDKIIADNNIKNVTMLPFQPYEDISHVFSLGDVSLVISKPGVGNNSVPSKTWSIMSASRPVIANFDENELKSIIEENNCGIFTKAGDKVAFTDAILKLYNSRDLCHLMGKNGRQFVLKNLTKEISTQKYIDVIKSFEK